MKGFKTNTIKTQVKYTKVIPYFDSVLITI